jgi:undecaprenyl diphosphate synthase
MSETFPQVQLPKHIGFIMDGNRRWAAATGKSESAGHTQGVKTLKEVVKTCAELGVEQMSFYVLSRENLMKRAKKEIKHLFALLLGWEEHADFLADYGLRLKILGNLGILPKNVINSIQKAAAKTQKGDKVINLCVNYSGREEIMHGVEAFVKEHGKFPKGEAEMGKIFGKGGRSDVDLIVRTGGHQRLSNFLLWDAAYAELYFTDALWPDFNEAEIKKALGWFADQKRNKGV